MTEALPEVLPLEVESPVVEDDVPPVAVDAPVVDVDEPVVRLPTVDVESPVVEDDVLPVEVDAPVVMTVIGLVVAVRVPPASTSNPSAFALLNTNTNRLATASVPLFNVESL